MKGIRCGRNHWYYVLCLEIKQSKPRQNDFLVRREWGELIKRVEFDGGGMAEGLGTKVELTLLVGHETGGSEEARSEKQVV